MMETAFSTGAALYGDDFGSEEIAQWYRDEKNAYAHLVAERSESYRYLYHELNRYHGFRHVSGPFSSVLAFGSAFGDELKPVLGQIQKITLLDASSEFSHSAFPGKECSRVIAQESGDLPFADQSFDLITCFGVLHHIPNVSHVLAEMNRCLSLGGHALIREPVKAMGDWSKPRPGLTPRERGIPKAWMLSTLERLNLEVVSATDCTFPLLNRLAAVARTALYDSRTLTRIDAHLSRLLSWNASYDPQTLLEKLGPGAAFYVVRRVR